MSATVTYKVGDDGPYTCECDRLPVGDITNLEIVAEQCVEDWHSRGGWECRSWPVTVVVLTPEGDELGRADVDRDTSPVFNTLNGSAQWVDVTEPPAAPKGTE